VRIGLVRETAEGERRVALTPEGVGRLVRAGHEVMVEAGAGRAAGIDDEAYPAAGARVMSNGEAVVEAADVVAAVQMPAAFWHGGPAVAGKALVALFRPLVALDAVERLRQGRVTSFSLDLVPRLTRTQGMDALSSMSTLAGYRAVILAAYELPRLFPLLMTAAGTVRPARVLVLGAGVAGLQAIATARRLGAVVEAFDTRSAAKDQVESLGARFLTLPVGEEGEGAGGYARALGADAHRREQALLAEPVALADAVITTALIPGRRAPLLITAEMVARMRPGSVIVDLAAEAGGNVALTVPGRRVEAAGVTILGPLNLPASVPEQASQLYSQNLVTYLLHLLAGPLARVDGELSVRREDEIARATLVTHAGEVLNEAVAARIAAGEAMEGVP
jgi:NAD(P) transhydrogenase subunit alpha